MLKLERTSVMNLENAMRGARNPMNSWGRMDSFYDENGEYKLGPNDLDLAKPSPIQPARCTKSPANRFRWTISAATT